MCIVSVNVDEAALRNIHPEIDSAAAIRLWAQELIDIRIREMRAEGEETMSIDEARAMTLKAIREEYARQ